MQEDERLLSNQCGNDALRQVSSLHGWNEGDALCGGRQFGELGGGSFWLCEEDASQGWSYLDWTFELKDVKMSEWEAKPRDIIVTVIPSHLKVVTFHS